MDVASIVGKVQTGLDKLDPSGIERMESVATITFEDHYAYQTLQSESFAGGLIELDTADYLYRTLGGSATTFNRKPLADRLTTLSLLGTLAKLRTQG